MSRSRKHSSDKHGLSGDPVAFSALVTQYQHSLFGFLGRMGLSQSQCEEVAQETFLRAWKNRKRYDSTKAAISTWLFTIARNLAINTLSSPSHQLEDLDTATPATAEQGSDPAEKYESYIRLSRLKQALETLSVSDRAVIATTYIPNLTEEEAAEVIGCSPGTMRTRLSRARKRLIAALNELEKHHG